MRKGNVIIIGAVVGVLFLYQMMLRNPGQFLSLIGAALTIYGILGLIKKKIYLVLAGKQYKGDHASDANHKYNGFLFDFTWSKNKILFPITVLGYFAMGGVLIYMGNI